MAKADKWQHLESFAHTNIIMFENETLCDVTLVAGNEQNQMKCHKFILASRSPVFHAMFCGTLAESKDVICVPDLDSSALRNLLRYLYSGTVELRADTVMSLLYAAKKYDVPGLESRCKSFLNDNIDVDNVCTILDQAIVFDDEDLKIKNLEFISRKTESVLQSDSFTRISKSGLTEVLKLETLSASECELYVACKQWASQRCRDAGKQETDDNIRQELGDDLISLIRFPSMTSEDFTNVVACENVLSKDEIISLFRSIIKKRNISNFNGNPRHSPYAKCLFIRCDAIAQPWDSREIQEGLSFTVSEDCTLSAVDVFLPSVEGSVTGVLEIIEGSTVILTQTLSLNYNRDAEHVLVKLEHHVRLSASKEYSVRSRTNGAHLYYCKQTNKRNITIQDVTLSLHNLKSGKSEYTNVSQGQFNGFEI